MKKEYLVKTSAIVVDNSQNTYIVSAHSQDEAKKIAQEKFKNEFSVVDNSISTTPFERNKGAAISAILMLIPILLSFITWYSGRETINLKPSFISVLLSVVLFSAYIFRFRGLDIIHSAIDTTLSIEVILLLSVIIKIILYEKKIQLLFGKSLPIDSIYLIVFAILMSWLGAKLVSVITMCVVILLSFSNIKLLDNAMPFWAAVLFALCTFFGVILYFYISSKKCDIFNNIKSSASSVKRRVHQDTNEAKEELSSMKEKLSGTISDIVKKG